LIKSRKQKEGITEYGLMNQLSLFSTQESQVPTKKLLWQVKNNCSKINIQKQNLSLILPPVLTKIDEVIKPFWNQLSTIIHNMLWQPHQIELPEPAFNLLNGSSNYRVSESSFWKNQIIPNNLTPKPLLLSLPAKRLESIQNMKFYGLIL